MLKHRSRNTLKIKQWLFFIPVQCYTTVSCKGWWMWLIKCPDIYNFSSAKLIRFGSVFSVKTGIKLTKKKTVYYRLCLILWPSCKPLPIIWETLFLFLAHVWTCPPLTVILKLKWIMVFLFISTLWMLYLSCADYCLCHGGPLINNSVNTEQAFYIGLRRHITFLH